MFPHSLAAYTGKAMGTRPSVRVRKIGACTMDVSGDRDGKKEGPMSGNGNDQPGLTVGSLLGVPLGAPESTPEAGTAATPESAAALGSGGPGEAFTTEEQPWTLANGRHGPRWSGPQFRGDGVEAISYNNVFDQSLEMVWFDGKIVYALDLGAVDVEPARVKVAQEDQLLYAPALDERGNATAALRRL